MNEQLIKKIKILFIIDKLVPAGTQNNLLEIVRHLDWEVFQATVVTLSKGDWMVDEFCSAGAEVYEWPVKRIYMPEGWVTWWKLLRLIKKERFQIVQTHFLIPELLVCFARIFVRIPKVITVRRDEGFWVSKRQRIVSNLCLKSFDCVLANSEAVKTACLRSERCLRPIHVIYNGVDMEKYQSIEGDRKHLREELGIAKDNLVAGIVANMRHEIKGYSYLIHAIPEVIKKHPKAKFLFVGDWALRANYEKLASDLGVRAHIVFAGSRQDVSRMINAMDVCCLTSLTEGFSNSILEYMAMSKPVIATNVGGNSEIVEDGKTGFLIPAGDFHALAEKMIILLGEHKMCRDMGREGRARIERQFSLQRMTNDYMNFYENIVNPGAGKRWPSSKIRILYVIWSLDLGGAEQVVMNLVRHIDRAKFEPVVCCLNQKGRYGADIEQSGTKVIELNKLPKLDPFIISKLMRVMKEEKIDLVHTHLFTSNLWGRLAAFFAGVPVVSTEHNMDSWKRFYHWLVDSILVRVTRKMIFVSEQVRNYYEQKLGALKDKSAVLYNGININQFAAKVDRADILREFGIAKDANVIGIVGRLVPQKGHGVFIEMIFNLRQKGVNAVGLIIGDGELRKELEKMRDDLKLKDFILFTGFRKDIDRLYVAMDVLVMTSTREGFPMTLLEAMAAGVPVVAADVGGVKECVTNGENGVLIDSAIAQDYADRVAELIDRIELRLKFIESGKRRVEREFSVSNMAANHEALYSTLVRGAKLALRRLDNCINK